MIREMTWRDIFMGYSTHNMSIAKFALAGALFVQSFNGECQSVPTGDTPWKLDIQASLQASGSGGGREVAVTLRMLNSDGRPSSTYASTADLAIYHIKSDEPVISEFDPKGYVEIINPRSQPVDIGGWEINLRRINHQLNRRLQFPTGTVLAPFQIASWADSDSAQEAIPHFVSPWAAEGFTDPIVHSVRLYDNHGTIRDEVSVFGGGNLRWSGRDLSYLEAHTRIGRSNHFNHSDWKPQVATTRRRSDSGMTLPWDSWDPIRGPSPSVELASGRWDGTVNIPLRPSSPVRLFARTSDGLVGWSDPLDVSSIPDLSIRLLSGSSPMSEMAPNSEAIYQISVPNPVGNALTVTLDTAPQDEFTFPPMVTIAAGQQSATFSAVNHDDANADGDSLVNITLLARGYRSVTVPLKNIDNERLPIHLIIPFTVRETDGWLPDAGGIVIDTPALHDVVVQLQSSPPIWTPGEVIIRKGQTFGSFSLRVDDDEILAPKDWTVEVRAHTHSDSSTRDSISISDSESNASLEIDLPSWILEGETRTVTIQAALPALRERILNLRIENIADRKDQLRLPSHVTLPAGDTSVSFQLEAIADSISQRSQDFDLHVDDPHFGIGTKERSRLLEKDKVSSQISLSTVSGALFSGDPIPINVTLLDEDNNLRPENAVGTIEIDPAVAPVTLQSPRQFNVSNGEWAGEMQIEGEALGIRPKVTIDQFTAVGNPIDLLHGFTIDFRALAMCWNNDTGTIFAAGIDSIAEISPTEKRITREIPIPEIGRTIVCVPGKPIVWISQLNQIRQLNTDHWTLDEPIPIDPANPNKTPTHMLAIPNAPNRVVVGFRTPHNQFGVGIYNNGFHEAPQTDLILNPILAMALDPAGNRVFVTTSNKLLAYAIRPNSPGLQPLQSIDLSTATATSNLAYFDGRLYRGLGEVYDATTLAPLATEVSQNTITPPYAFPDLNLTLTFDHRGITMYHPSTGEVRAGHYLPGNSNSAFQRWGHRGLAYYSQSTEQTIFLETPIFDQATPDLRLRLLPSPDSISLKNLTPWTWELEVINTGSTLAQKVQLHSDHDNILLGPLPPGERRVIKVARGSSQAQLYSETFAVSSLRLDAHPEDNSVTARMKVSLPSFPNQSALVLGTTDLITNPGKDLLFATLNKAAGEALDGVVVIDPVRAVQIATFETGPDPRRLAVSHGGRYLFVQVGQSGVERWNTSTRQRDASWSISEPILNLIPLPHGSSESELLLVTATSLTIHTGTSNGARWSPATGSDTLRSAGFAEADLYAVGTSQLYHLSFVNSQIVEKTQFPMPTLNKSEFLFDGRYLVFSGQSFDTQTSSFLNNFQTNSPYLVDKANQRLLVMQGSNLMASLLPSPTLYPIHQSIAHDFLQIVCWGIDGIAGRTQSNQVIIWRHPSLIEPVSADPAVEVIEPIQLIGQGPAEWRVRVHNPSEVTIPYAYLTLTVDSNLRDVEIRNANIAHRHFNRFVIDLSSLPPRSTRELILSHTLFSSRMTFSALLEANVPSSTRADDSLTRSFRGGYPQADLRVTDKQIPMSVTPGVPFEFRVTVENLGPDRVDEITLDTRSDSIFFPIPASTLSLAHGERGTITAMATAPTDPGLHVITAFVMGSGEPSLSNNNASSLVYVPGPPSDSSIREWTLPRGSNLAPWTWHSQRSEFLAAFPGEVPGCYRLDASLGILGELPFLDSVRDIKLTPDGRHAWILTQEGKAVRVNSESMTIEHQSFLSDGFERVGQFEIVPGNAEQLVTAIGDRIVIVTPTAVQLVETIPENGKATIFVMRTAGGLRFRVFAPSGELVRDTNDSQVTPDKITARDELRNWIEQPENLIPTLANQRELSHRVREVLAFEIESPLHYHLPGARFGDSFNDLAVSGDKVYVHYRQNLSRFRIEPNGIEFEENYPGIGALNPPWSVVPLGRKLFLSSVGIFDTETEQVATNLPNLFFPITAAPKSSQIYGLRHSSTGQFLTILDGQADNSPVLQIPMDFSNLSLDGVAMGSHGVLVLPSSSSPGPGRSVIFRSQNVPPNIPEIDLDWTSPSGFNSVGSEIAAKLTTTPLAPWVAHDAKVTFELSSAIQFADPPPFRSLDQNKGSPPRGHTRSNDDRHPAPRKQSWTSRDPSHRGFQ